MYCYYVTFLFAFYVYYILSVKFLQFPVGCNKTTIHLNNTNYMKVSLIYRTIPSIGILSYYEINILRLLSFVLAYTSSNVLIILTYDITQNVANKFFISMIIKFHKKLTKDGL